MLCWERRLPLATRVRCSSPLPPSLLHRSTDLPSSPGNGHGVAHNRYEQTGSFTMLRHRSLRRARGLRGRHLVRNAKSNSRHFSRQMLISSIATRSSSKRSRSSRSCRRSRTLRSGEQYESAEVRESKTDWATAVAASSLRSESSSRTWHQQSTSARLEIFLLDPMDPGL